jgi:hypothetical protein
MSWLPRAQLLPTPGSRWRTQRRQSVVGEGVRELAGCEVVVERRPVPPDPDSPSPRRDSAGSSVVVDAVNHDEVGWLEGRAGGNPGLQLGQPVTRSTSTQRVGSSSVRRDYLVLVSPPVRTDRHRSRVGGSPSRSTRSKGPQLVHEIPQPGDANLWSGMLGDNKCLGEYPIVCIHLFASL